MCSRLNRDLLLETMKLSFDASGGLGSSYSMLLQYTRLSKSTEPNHCVPMHGSVEIEQKKSRMKTCSQILPFTLSVLFCVIPAFQSSKNDVQLPNEDALVKIQKSTEASRMFS